MLLYPLPPSFSPRPPNTHHNTYAYASPPATPPICCVHARTHAWLVRACTLQETDEDEDELGEDEEEGMDWDELEEEAME